MKGVPLLISKCCSIPVGKTASAVRHFVAVSRPFVRYMATGEDTFSDEVTGERSVRDTMIARSGVQAFPRTDIGSVEEGNVVAQKEKSKRVQEF